MLTAGVVVGPVVSDPVGGGVEPFDVDSVDDGPSVGLPAPPLDAHAAAMSAIGTIAADSSQRRRVPSFENVMYRPFHVEDGLRRVVPALLTGGGRIAP